MRRLPDWVLALWWGSLTSLGLWVVPLLFVHLPAPALAGGMAAKLFSAQTWVSVVCGLLLLLLARPGRAAGSESGRSPGVMFVLAGMVLALWLEFAVAPRIVQRDNLRLWHGVGSAMYLLQWLCVSASYWLLSSPPRQAHQL